MTDTSVSTRMRRYALIGAIPLGLLAVFLSCNSAPPQRAPGVAEASVGVSNTALAPAASVAPATAHKETHVEIVNVNIYLDPQLILCIHHLTGKFLPTKKDQPPTFDDKGSYIIAVDSAEVHVSMASLSHAMNTYVFGDPHAPLTDLRVSAQGSQLKQEGKIRKGIGIPFEMLGDVSATPDGKIRIHPTQIKVAHLPVKGLMKVFGLDTENVVNTKNTRGVTVDDNDIILDPTAMLPPPAMRGRISGVRVSGDEMIQTFGTARLDAPEKRSPSNYMAYKGGVLRFGKMTMNDADMQLIDEDATDAFDFFPDHYQDQLVAGYSKTTASGALRVYMPDYNKIARTRSNNLKPAGL
jgi:hypothetical protein